MLGGVKNLFIACNFGLCRKVVVQSPGSVRQIKIEKKPHDKAGGWCGLKTCGLHQALGCIVVMTLDATFMLHHLAIKFVHQFIDCGVQISVRALGEHVGALDVNVALRSLSQLFLLLFFHGQQDLDVNHLVEVAFDPIKLGGNVIAQRRGDFEVMAADRQVHK
jgi:hypothetical protein